MEPAHKMPICAQWDRYPSSRALAWLHKIVLKAVSNISMTKRRKPVAKPNGLLFDPAGEEMEVF
jgi:hypothetical protein